MRFVSSRPQASLPFASDQFGQFDGRPAGDTIPPLAALGAPTTECVMPHNRSALHTDVGLVCERIPLLPPSAPAPSSTPERERERERAAAIRAACISRGE